MSTDLNDQQIKELLEGITQGEWRHEYSAQRGNTVWAQITSTGSMQIAETNFAEFDAQNAKFIAAAPALVAQLQRQRDSTLAEKEAANKFAVHLMERGEQLQRRVKAFQEGYRDKAFEVTALEIQMLDLKAHGVDKVTARVNESLRTKLTAACIERNEAQNEAAELRSQLAAVQAEIERITADRDELSKTIEACHDLLDRVDPEYVEGTTSLVPLDDRLKEELFPEGLITDDMVNGDD